MQASEQNDWMIAIADLTARQGYMTPYVHLRAKRVLEYLKRQNLWPNKCLQATLVTCHKTTYQGVEPEAPHVIMDAWLTKPGAMFFYDFNSNSASQCPSLSDTLMIAWMPTRTNQDEHPGIMHIPHTGAGLGQCQLDISTPYNNGQVLFAPWQSTFLPAGAIVLPDITGFAITRHIVHIEGVMVWFLWPPTPKNLKWFYGNTKRNYADDSTIIHRAFDHLDGLELHFVTKLTSFSIAPSVIFASLSITTSIFTEVGLHLPSTIDGCIRTASIRVNQLLDHACHGMAHTDAIAEINLFLNEASSFATFLSHSEQRELQKIERRVNFTRVPT